MSHLPNLEQADLLAKLVPSAEHPVCWLQVGQALDAPGRRMLKVAHLVYDRERLRYCGSEPPAPGAHGLTQPAPDLVLPDYTALPGLFEAHSHIFLEGAELATDKRTQYQQQDGEALLAIAQRRVATLARLGVIAMRDGGDKDRVGLRLSQLTRNGHCPPFTARVFSPGAGIHREGRYGAFFGRPVEEHPDIASCVSERVSAGADHVKVVPTGIINFNKGQVTAAPQFTVAELAQFKLAAQAHGRHLMAHASGAVGIGRAIDGGVDTIEHGFFVTLEQLQKMRDRGIAWVPTFTPVQEQIDHAEAMGWRGETVDHLRRIIADHGHSLRLALELGVTVLVGSDSGSCGVGHGVGLLREMELMAQAGMSPLAILCQATWGNVQALCPQESIGALAAGRRARFILTRHDPLQRITALDEPRLVIFDGAVCDTRTVPLAGL